MLKNEANDKFLTEIWTDEVCVKTVGHVLICLSEVQSEVPITPGTARLIFYMDIYVYKPVLNLVGTAVHLLQQYVYSCSLYICSHLLSVHMCVCVTHALNF